MHVSRTYVITANYLTLSKVETFKVMRITRGIDFHIGDFSEP